MHTIFQVQFGVHVPEDSIACMAGGLASHGLLRRDGKSRRYVVDVQRPARAATLKKELQRLESYGFLTYQAQEQSED